MPNELSDTITRMRERPDLGPAFAEADAVLREYDQVLEQLGGQEQLTTQVTNSADITNYTLPEGATALAKESSRSSRQRTPRSTTVQPSLELVTS